MNLFIVESPTKAKTIAKYLGKGWIVKATLGHIKDLPEDSLGVDKESLEPKYVWVMGKKKLVEEIKRLSSKAEEVYLGTDPDREGEAIAYFLAMELKRSAKKIKRAVFYEITKPALISSIEKAGKINMNLVYSQFARRVLDRLIGYELSPFLWKEFKVRTLSVGRVQSPALRLIVEREKEIQSFKQKKYYYVKMEFEKDGITFYATLNQRFEKPDNAQPFLKKLRSAFFEVKSVKTKEEALPPPKPFNTASLQAEASKLLSLTVDKVQRIAQKLYENGYITYPRTDSYRMNKEKVEEFMRYIKKVYGEEYVGRLREFREKPLAQGAHECIRPTRLKESPQEPLEKALYELIVRRTLASLSTPAIKEKTSVEIIPTGEENITLFAEGVKVLFDGWTKIYPTELEQRELPQLEEGEVLKPKRVFIEERKTQPPPRYTEGTLVKTLERLGIGRPSTYASLVKTLKDRGYVVVEKGELKPTPIAFEVVNYLIEKCPKLMDYGFTKEMEDKLDLVEEGKKDWKEVVREFYSQIFSPS